MTRTPSTLNIPLIALWVVDIAIVVAGYVVMSVSDAGQAAFYNSGGADYGQYFPALSGSTLGGSLIAVGALGVVLTLALQALGRGRALSAAASAVAEATVVDEARDVEADAAAAASEDAPAARDAVPAAR